MLEAQEPPAPKAPNGVAAKPEQPQAPKAGTSDAQGGGSRVVACGEESANGPAVVCQGISPGAPALETHAPDAALDAPPPKDHPSGPGRCRLYHESLLKRKRSPCRDDDTRRPLKPGRYVAADE